MQSKSIVRATACAALSISGWFISTSVLAAEPVRIGLMLPASGTFASLGKSIDEGFRLAIAEHGGTISGRRVEYVSLDDESNPSRAVENASRLINRDRVDVLVGSVHSGVALAMAKVARDNNVIMIVPNAGADELTDSQCSRNVFRTSFSNWQPGFATGKLLAGKHKTAVTITWKYAAGQESVAGFKEAFEKGGGKVLKELWVPFPNVEFQALLTEVAALKPDAVYVFFGGAGAVKFTKDYEAAGLKGKIPLSGAFVTEGTLAAQGSSAQGLQTVLHYADGIDTPTNQRFISAYKKAYGSVPDVFAVQGYDAAQLYVAGLKAVDGDLSKRDQIIKAMSAAKLDSPRGPVTFSRSHNPIQNMYLRNVKGTENVLAGVVIEALEQPAPSCKL